MLDISIRCRRERQSVFRLDTDIREGNNDALRPEFQQRPLRLQHPVDISFPALAGTWNIKVLG